MYTPSIVRIAAVCLLAAVSSTCASPPADGRYPVEIELLDAERMAPRYGLIRVSDAQGRAVPLGELLCRGLGLEEKHPARGWYVLPGRASVRVPPGILRYEGILGLETETAARELDLSGLAGDTATVKLSPPRFYHAAAEGWRSANTHLHLQKISRAEADRYLSEVPRADGLDALFVSYLERTGADQEYISNQLTDADLKAFSSKTGILFGGGEEHRHNFTAFGEGYGHVMFLNPKKLILPVSIGPGIMSKGTDGIPLQRGIDEAKKDGATVLWCHNSFGLEDIPNWITGRPHAQNIFDGEPSTHGSYKDTFYRYLNAGLRVPFSTGTDWFIYDFSRVYARTPSMNGVRDWLGVLEKGRTFITNGPFLELEVNGRTPGETISLDQPGPVHVVAKATGRVDFRWLELIRNGDVVKAAPSRPAGGHFSCEQALDLDVRSPCWIAARIPPPPEKGEPSEGAPRSELGGPLFAHTSPVYVQVTGRHVFDREVAQGLLEEVKRARESIQGKAVFGDEHERSHVLEVYSAAILVLEKNLR